MSTSNLDSADLKAVLAGGLIREDVMDKIWIISPTETPFVSRCGSGDTGNAYYEWTQDSLAAPDLTNKKIDGSDQNTVNNTRTGARVGNHCQIGSKTVQVSSRADASNTIGRARELAYQVMRRQQELRRDEEAQFVSNQGSVADDGSAAAGSAASVFAWSSVNKNMGATGTVPGFQTGTKLVTAVTPGTKRAGSETAVRDLCQAIYIAGGNPDVFMSVPQVIRKFSEYLFTTSARVATLTSEIGQSQDAATAKGAINVFVTDFEVVLKLIPNRIMQDHSTGAAHAGLFDFEQISVVKKRGYQTESLAKTGLSEIRMITVDQTLSVGNPSAIGIYGDIDYALAFTA